MTCTSGPSPSRFPPGQAPNTTANMPGENPSSAQGAVIRLPSPESHPTHPALELGPKSKKNKKKGAKAQENIQHQQMSENQENVAQVCDGPLLAIAIVAEGHRTPWMMQTVQ